MSKKDKIIFWVLYLISFIGFAFMLFDQYKLFKLSENDLVEVNVIFDEYVKGENGHFNIKTKDNTIYGIEVIVDKDEELYNGLKENDKIRILYFDNGNKYYDYLIIEMYVGDDCVVSLDDYHEDYKKQITISAIILIAVFVVLPIVIYNIFKYLIRRIDNMPLKKKIDYNSKEVIKRKEELKELVKYENDKYYANFENEFNDDISLDILQSILFEELENEELRLIYDINYGDEIVYCAFKYNNKLMFNIAYIDKNDVLYIDDFMLVWTFNDYEDFNKEEREIFEREFKKYGESVNRKTEIVSE